MARAPHALLSYSLQLNSGVTFATPTAKAGSVARASEGLTARNSARHVVVAPVGTQHDPLVGCPPRRAPGTQRTGASARVRGCRAGAGSPTPDRAGRRGTGQHAAAPVSVWRCAARCAGPLAPRTHRRAQTALSRRRPECNESLQLTGICGWRVLRTRSYFTPCN